MESAAVLRRMAGQIVLTISAMGARVTDVNLSGRCLVVAMGRAVTTVLDQAPVQVGATATGARRKLEVTGAVGRTETGPEAGDQATTGTEGAQAVTTPLHREAPYQRVISMTLRMPCPSPLHTAAHQPRELMI